MLSGAQWQLQSTAGSGWAGRPCPSPAGRLLSRAALVLPEASSLPPSRHCRPPPASGCPHCTTLHCATLFKCSPARGCSRMHLLEGPADAPVPFLLLKPSASLCSGICCWMCGVWCVVRGVRAVCTSHPARALLWGSRPRITCPVSPHVAPASPLFEEEWPENSRLQSREPWARGWGSGSLTSGG